MRKHFHVIVIAILLFGSVPGALAWDFSAPGTIVSSIHHRNRPTLAALSDDSSSTGQSGHSSSGVPYSATSTLTVRPSISVWDSVKLSGVFSVQGHYSRFPDPVIDGNHGAVFPGPPPFDGYYNPMKHPSKELDPQKAKMEQLWLTIQSNNVDRSWGMGVMVGTRDLPFGVGATLGHDEPHQLLAGVFRAGPVTMLMGTGATLPTAYGRTRSIPALPYGPFRLIGSRVGHFTFEQAPPVIGVAALALPGYALALPIDIALTILLSPISKFFTEDGEPALISLFTDSWTTAMFGSEETGYKDCLMSQMFETDAAGHLYIPPFIRNTDSIRNGYQLNGDSAIPFDIFLVKYTYGSVEAGLATMHYPYPAYAVPTFTTRLHGEDDDRANRWMVYIAYTGVNTFAHAELSRFGWDIFPARGGHDYRVGWHMFTECGARLGPATASLMYAFASGENLKDPDTERTRTPYPIRNQATERYESLMFGTFGGGNMAFEGPTGRCQGMMSDAYAIGARLDYALAGNLNIWSSYMWAHRWEKYGTRFGQYAGAGRLATPTERHVFAQKAGRALVAGPDDYGYVSNGSLGWEMNLGANWSIIQDLDLNVQGSYWKPGGWFREAYLGNTSQKDGYVDPQVIDNPNSVTGLTCSLSFQF